MSSCPLPWFPIYGAELLADETFQVWSLEVRGAWLTLLAYAWKEGSIPADEKALARLLNVDGSAIGQLLACLKGRFAKLEENPDRMVSPRQELERAKALTLQETRSVGGAKGAKARWDKENARKLGNGSANGSPIAKPIANTCPIPLPLPLPIIKEVPLTPSQGTGQGAKKPKGKREPKTRTTELDRYPQELHEAVSTWRVLLKALKEPELQERFPEDKRFVASGVGTTEDAMRAWEKHLSSTVQGHPVTNADILAAVRIWATERLRKANAGEALAAKMLSTMINHADFVDALRHAVMARLQAQVVPDAS